MKGKKDNVALMLMIVAILVVVVIAFAVVVRADDNSVWESIDQYQVSPGVEIYHVYDQSTDTSCYVTASEIGGADEDALSSVSCMH